MCVIGCYILADRITYWSQTIVVLLDSIIANLGPKPVKSFLLAHWEEHQTESSMCSVQSKTRTRSDPQTLLIKCKLARTQLEVLMYTSALMKGWAGFSQREKPSGSQAGVSFPVFPRTSTLSNVFSEPSLEPVSESMESKEVYA